MPVPQQVVWALCLVVFVLVINYLRKSARATVPRIELPIAGETPDAAFADLFDEAPIGYLEIDRKGIVRRMNRRQCDLLGAEANSLVGKPCTELIPEPERKRYGAQISQKMSGELAVAASHERDYLKPDGSTVAVEVHEQLLYDDSGRVVGMRLAIIDVSQRKKSEQEGYQIAAELKALFQAFPDLFLRLDRDGNVLDSKGGHHSDPFLTLETFSGKNIADILPPEATTQIGEAQERGRKSGAMAIAEFAVEGQFGRQCYEARLVPLDWEEWTAILRNITDRKADEQKLKHNAQQLEQKNEELESALVTAREATQMKSRFLANMSHEIRTPMNGVLGMTDFLLGTELNEEQLEFARSIQRSATSLLALINDILDLSRIEAGKLRLNQVAFPLRTVLEETVSLFALQARAKGLEFVVDIAPGLAVNAVGDPDRLRQVLVNLLGNAIKFTSAGRIGIIAEMMSETESNFQARFVVYDTGIGIPRDQFDRIFESFTQGDTSSTRKYGGTGLGLAISQQLVELQGGQIGVESEPEHGSRFWFTVLFGKPVGTEKELVAATPVREVAPAPEATEAPAAPAPPVSAPDEPQQIVAMSQAVAEPPPVAVTIVQTQAAAPAGAAVNGIRRSSRILLAEDNEINQRITLRLLQKLGLSAEAVVNGQEAVDAIAKRDYDLVLMDCQMPIMDGYEATAVVRSREGATKRHIPICALTANAMKGDRERCLASGMDDYISKPVSIDKLQDAIERWVPGSVKTTSTSTTGEQAPGAVKA